MLVDMGLQGASIRLPEEYVSEASEIKQRILLRCRFYYTFIQFEFNLILGSFVSVEKTLF